MSDTSTGGVHGDTLGGKVEWTCCRNGAVGYVSYLKKEAALVKRGICPTCGGGLKPSPHTGMPLCKGRGNETL